MFGATGDLSRRRLLPGLAHLSLSALAPDIQVVATSLDELDNEQFRKLVSQAMREFSHRQLERDQWMRFAERVNYVPASRGAAGLAAAVAAAEAKLGPQAQRLHYLSVPPAAAPVVIQTLREAALVERARVIMEKPFGTDLESAITLNDQVHETFAESQIFRIDHFLGKEAAQNILAFRFANGLFEPIWNRNFIDHIQIDIPETLGLDLRANFYEATGAYKDMVVTHLFQVLAFVAMEPPTALEPRAISEEKNKVFRSLLPIDPGNVVRGQYSGYREEKGVAPRLRHRDLHRAAGRPRQLALGGRAFLPAHRQAHGRGPAHHLDRVQGSAAHDVPGGFRRRRLGPGPPHLRPRRRVEGVAVFLRQAARAGDAAREAQHAVLDPGNGPRRRRARSLRAADPRRDARRPHAVHHGRRHRVACGSVPSRCCATRRR